MSQVGDGDYAEVSSDAWRKARKPYTCTACHGPIRVGDRYRYVSYLFDGDWYRSKRCERCQVLYEHLAARLRDEGDRDEFCDDDLNCGHTYEERWEEEPPPELAALAFWLPGDPLPGSP